MREIQEVTKVKIPGSKLRDYWYSSYKSHSRLTPTCKDELKNWARRGEVTVTPHLSCWLFHTLPSLLSSFPPSFSNSTPPPLNYKPTPSRNVRSLPRVLCNRPSTPPWEELCLRQIVALSPKPTRSTTVRFHPTPPGLISARFGFNSMWLEEIELNSISHPRVLTEDLCNGSVENWTQLRWHNEVIKNEKAMNNSKSNTAIFWWL